MKQINLISLTPKELTEELSEGLKEVVQHLLNDSISNQRNEKEYITRKETARLLGVSTVTLHSWCNKGILKPYKLGNRTYFKYEEIKSSLNNSNLVA